jgi:hypothetical protein
MLGGDVVCATTDDEPEWPHSCILQERNRRPLVGSHLDLLTLASPRASSAPLQAISISCDGCGATFGVLPKQGRARCPHCQREHRISSSTLGQLEQYQSAAQVELAQVEAALDRVEAGRVFRQRNWLGSGKSLVVGFGIYQAATMAVVLLLSKLAILDAKAAGAVLAVSLVLVPIVAVKYVLPRLHARSNRAFAPLSTAAPLLPRLRVACPTCGAVNEMPAGAASHRCQYCQTAIVASQVVMQHGMDAAVSAHRQARLEDLREARRVAAALPEASTGGGGVLFLFGAVLTITGLGKAAATVVAVQNDQPINEVSDFYGPLAAALLAASAMLASFLFQVRRRARYWSALDKLVAPYGGVPFQTRAALVDWLNLHWSAPYELDRVPFGRYFIGAHGTVARFPFFLQANLWPPDSAAPSLHLLLAAQFSPPGTVASQAKLAGQRAIERCQAYGFEVRFSEAGFLAVARADKLEALRRSGRELEGLDPAIAALAEAALAVGAAPG